MENIDYTEKIATFNLLVGNNNEEIAFNYLTLSNWDETKAAMLYNQENKGANAKAQTSIKIPAYQNKEYNNSIYKNNKNYQPLKYQTTNNNYYNSYIEPKISNINSKINISKLNKYQSCPIFKKGLLDTFKFFKTDNRGYCQYFCNISKKCLKLYDTFINNLENNVGVILIYNKSTYNAAIDILRNLNSNEVTKELLNTKTVILPLIKGCLEGDQIIKDMKITNFPCILICFYKNYTSFAVIKKIENINQNIKLFNEGLFEAHDLFNEGSNLPSFTNNNNSQILQQPKNDFFANNLNNNLINNINNNTNNIQNNNNKKQSLLDDLNNYLPEDINGLNRNSSLGSNPGSNRDSFKIKNRDSYSNMTDAEVLARQEREMKILERMEEKKKLEEEKKEREKKEEEEKKKNEEMMEKIQKDSILSMLPEEPSDDNPDKCVILFRFPDGEKVVQRKFLKTDNVSLLYLYVKSLGREIYNENEEHHFSLIQSFPFKNFDEVQNNSLEQEGLFPNAMLQIKAIE